MTNFNRKLTEQFTNLSISLLNEPKYKKHLYADYVELVTLFSKDFISQNEIIDRLSDNGEVFSVVEIPDGQLGSYDAEKYDRAEAWINSVYEYLEERIIVYGDYYPFTYDNTKGLKLKDKTSLTDKQKVYIFLLEASSLNFFKKIQSELTSDFEILSEWVLKTYLPSNAKVYGFGSNTYFRGNARDKISQLASEINVIVHDRIITQIPITSSKEEGLDIVGWIPFNDSNPNTIIILGQCACGKDWFGKQNETKRYDRFYASYLNPFTYALFLPGDFKNNKGLFGMDKDFTNNQIIFERRRLIDLTVDDILSKLKYTKAIVDNSLNYVEDIV